MKHWTSRILMYGAVLIGGLLAGTAAQALDFDFTTLGANNTELGTSVTVNGIVAEGFDHDSEAFPTNLWLRNEPNDNGLGVCGLGRQACIDGGGDENELDNSDSFEVIRLTNTNGGEWTSLWVSSLDGRESGTVFWGSACDTCFVGSFSFSAGDFGLGVVEGDILTLAAAAGFDASAIYLAFIPGTQCCGDQFTGDNDYLIWRGSVNVPEPATLALLGAGLVGLGFAARRRRRP